jgi:hypothetical protein
MQHALVRYPRKIVRARPELRDAFMTRCWRTEYVNESYVTPMVNLAFGEGKVQRLYESWGYGSIGTSQPSLEFPVLTVMIRPTLGCSSLA